MLKLRKRRCVVADNSLVKYVCQSFLLIERATCSSSQHHVLLVCLLQTFALCCPTVCLSVCLSVYYTSLLTSVDPCIHPSTLRFVSPAVHPPINPLIHPSIRPLFIAFTELQWLVCVVCVFIRPSIHPSINPWNDSLTHLA